MVAQCESKGTLTSLRTQAKKIAAAWLNQMDVAGKPADLAEVQICDPEDSSTMPWMCLCRVCT